MEKQVTSWTYPISFLILLAVGFLLLVPTFWGGLEHLVMRWDKQEEYSHGYMIPMVVAYLIWQRRDFLSKIEFKPSWIPVSLVLVGVFISIIGEISALYILIHFSIILIILAMAWSLMGWQAFKYVLVPLLLLITAIPLPYFLEASLTAELQLLSTRLGVGFIRLFAIPVFAEGNIIDLGSYKLQVVEACSGLRYMYPLMSVGFIAAYMYQVEFWKRALVFISTIPITILMNSFRIGVIGILVEHWGSGMAEGFLHYFEGWIIFMACLSILILEMWLLNKLGDGSRSFSQVFILPVSTIDAGTTVEHKYRKLSAPFLVNVGLVAIAFVLINALDTRAEIIPQRSAFVNYPTKVGDWVGEQDNLPSLIVDTLGMSDYLLNDYKSKSGLPVNFYVAYYGSQRKGVSPHSPRVCVPGGGWSISELRREKINLPKIETEIPVNRVIIQNGLQKQIVYYWFKQRGRDIANEYWMKWFLLVDSLSINRTDGSLVRITTPIGSNESEAAADARLQEFISDMDPVLRDFVPG